MEETSGEVVKEEEGEGDADAFSGKEKVMDLRGKRCKEGGTDA